MNKMDKLHVLAELAKQNIEQNDYFSASEKQWRRIGVEETEKCAKLLYEKNSRFQKKK